jgi:signal transduction histidine kinase/HAMP domain-containing protein
MAWLLPLLALVFAAVMFWLSTVPRDALYANNLEIVRRASRAVVSATEASMLNAQGDHPWDWLTPRIATQEGSWIRIVGARGRMVFSSNPAELETRPDLDDPSCAPCHARDPDPVPATAIMPGPGGDHFQVLATPLPNRDECRVCHEAQELNVGIILVGQSIEPIRRVVRTVWIGIAVAGGVALLLTLLTTRMVLGRLLGRPLRRLVKGARSIGAGNLEQPIDLGERTELTVLADALNLSTSRLAEMVHRVERQRDEFQTLYHFTDQISRSVLPEERRLRAVELATQFLGAECVLVQADYQPESQTGQGTITLREAGSFEDHPFRFGPDSRQGVPPFLSRIIERWLKGEFDDTAMVREGWIVGYPVRHEGGRHLGLLLLPVAHPGEAEGEPPNPDLVRAMCRHIAIAIEFSGMQTELVGQERLAAIGETIAGLAHCLKNALNALRAGLFITDRALDKDDPEKLRRGWGITKVGIRQIEGLSLDMLYYVKERKPERTPTNPNVVVGEVIDLLREMASEKEVQLRGELDEQVGSELLDRTTIYRAILNLVTNAIDACTESETGDLVVVRTRSEPDKIVLTVADNGIGMTDDVRSRLFTRFFTTKAGKGTGLGLAVVKKIVEEHGGTVEVESEPGRGSSFHIHLPRSN